MPPRCRVNQAKVLKGEACECEACTLIRAKRNGEPLAEAKLHALAEEDYRPPVVNHEIDTRLRG